MKFCKTEADLILLNGPPFVGIQQYYEEHLSKTHKCLIPSEIFSQGQSIGLRDVGLKIVQHVQKGLKVAVLDGNELRKTRESYVKLLRKKCSNSRILVINIFPKYGCRQVFWSREFAFAATAQCDIKTVSIADKQIFKWFEKETDTEIAYRFGQVDVVNESEGCSIQTQTCGLSSKSVYKWEVPGLFVQWEIIFQELENDRQIDSIVDVMRIWINHNPCGRIIVIGDGNKIKTGEETKYQEIADIKSAINSVCEQLGEGCVYVYHIEDPDQAGLFVQPPRPGILAYLQMRHSLNLHSKYTCYLYQSSDHMKMAENAGVRHIKGTKALRNPNLIKSQTVMTIPAIPEMLKSLELVAEFRDSDPGQDIPLYDVKNEFQDGMVSNDIGRGRTEHLFASEWSIINKMQDLYQQMASKVGEAGSKMSPEKSNQSVGFVPLMSEMDLSKTSFVSRDLPRWMLGKAESGSKSLKSSAEQSGDVVIDDHSKKKTIYMMTDHELVETAIGILKQAGKTDLINSFKSRQEIACSGKRDRKKKRSPGNRQTKSLSGNKRKLINESLSSSCPKMEPYSEDEYEDVSCNGSKKMKNGKSNLQREYDVSAKRHSETENIDSELLIESLSDSEDSVDCPNTETSQGEEDSLDLESEVEDLVAEDVAPFDDVGDLGMKVNETVDASCHEGLNISDNSNCKQIRGKPCETSHLKLVLKSARKTDSKSRLKEQALNSKEKTNVSSKRHHHKPDLSILDEIFD